MKEKSKRKGRPARRWLIIAASFGLLGVAAGLYIFFVSYDALKNGLGYDKQFTGDEARRAIEQWAGPPVPDEAENVHYRIFGFQDYVVLMRLDLPPLAMQTWLGLAMRDGMCFSDDDLEPSGWVHTQVFDVPWWHTEQPGTPYVSGSCGSGPFHRLMLDQGDNDIWRLYWQVFTT